MEVSFLLRSAAKKEYTLFAMCDSWIGCDVHVPLHLKASHCSHFTSPPFCRGPVLYAIIFFPVALGGGKRPSAHLEIPLWLFSRL